MSADHMQRYEAALADRPVLRTARLMLRRPAEQDIPEIIAIAGDWEIASRVSRVPHPYSEADARFFLNEILPETLSWAIVERASGKMAGMIGLSRFEQQPGTFELGYYVAPDRWGRGIATEAGSVVVAYGAGLVGRERIRSGFFADNPASGRVLEKLGFTALRESERRCLATGSVKRSIELGLTDHDANPQVNPLPSSRSTGTN